jgi:hypothetical protein
MNYQEVEKELNEREKVIFRILDNIFNYLNDEIYVYKDDDKDDKNCYSICSFVDDDTKHEFKIQLSYHKVYISMRNGSGMAYITFTVGGFNNKNKKDFNNKKSKEEFDTFCQEYKLSSDKIYKYFLPKLKEKAIDYDTYKLKVFEKSFYKRFGINRQVKLSNIDKLL